MAGAELFHTHHCRLRTVPTPCLAWPNKQECAAARGLLQNAHGIAQSFARQAITVRDCPHLLEEGADFLETLEQIKAMADPRDPGCYSYMATACCGHLVGIGVAWAKKDRHGLAKLALALAASQDVAKVERARLLHWMDTEMCNDFADLRGTWGRLRETYGSHDVQQTHQRTDAVSEEPSQVKCDFAVPSAPDLEDPQQSDAFPEPAPNSGPTSTSDFDVQALKVPSAAEAVWGPTCYDFTNSLGKVDTTVAYCSGAFLALGEIVCMDRYILMQAHVVNRGFQRAPLAMEREFDFPHMTLVKLEAGESERLCDDTIWKSAVRNCDMNITRMLRQLNHDVRSLGLPFRLVPAHVQQCWYGNRYNITGGEGLKVFRTLQALIYSRCARLGQGSLQEWSQDPAHPHITYEYPDAIEEAHGHGWEERSSLGSCRSSSDGRASSLPRVLECLDAAKLQRYRKIFKKERLGVSALLGMDDARLKEAGVSAMGDRIKILNIREALRAERQ